MIIMGSALVLCLTGCSSGVSQSEYDTLNSSYESLQKDYQELQSQYDKIKADYEASLNEETESLISSLPGEGGQAWATSCYGDDAISFVGGDTLYVAAFTDYDMSADSASKVWESFVSSMRIYGYTAPTSPSMFPFKRIDVTFYAQDGNALAQFSSNCDDFSLNDVLVNGSHATEIISGLGK